VLKNLEITRTINGTKRRGKVGEIILKQILAEPISAGLITTDLKMDNGTVVEFAWDLKNGKFLPMDSKLPELEDLLNEFDLSEDPSEQAKIKKNIKIMTKVNQRQKNI
jgi:DNA recombination protein RmuC